MTQLIMVMGIVPKLVKVRGAWIMGVMMLILTRVTVMGKTAIVSVLWLRWLIWEGRWGLVVRSCLRMNAAEGGRWWKVGPLWICRVVLANQTFYAIIIVVIAILRASGRGISNQLAHRKRVRNGIIGFTIAGATLLLLCRVRWIGHPINRASLILSVKMLLLLLSRSSVTGIVGWVHLAVTLTMRIVPCRMGLRRICYKRTILCVRMNLCMWLTVRPCSCTLRWWAYRLIIMFGLLLRSLWWLSMALTLVLRLAALWMSVTTALVMALRMTSRSLVLIRNSDWVTLRLLAVTM